jgi:predicted GTPase
MGACGLGICAKHPHRPHPYHTHTGTNVVLERQQRLTEEFIPRADLVLFVMSADRPLTDSEVRFLRYVRRWGKKVVFVVNKVRAPCVLGMYAW